MARKGKNSKSEKDSAKPDPASGEKPSPEKKSDLPEQEPATSLPEESLPPALALSPKRKKEKKSSGVWGILLFFLLIVAGGVGAGGFYLYQEQMKFHNETLAKLAQLEAQLNALDTEAGQTRQNKQSLDALNQDLQQFKADMDTTLKTHQNSLATLDEDVMRLKEKVEPPIEAPPVPPSLIDGIDTEPGLVPGEILPESQDEEAPEDTGTEEEDSSQESQKFVEWMENFFAAIWNWFAGLFS